MPHHSDFGTISKNVAKERQSEKKSVGKKVHGLCRSQRKRKSQVFLIKSKLSLLSGSQKNLVNNLNYYHFHRKGVTQWNGNFPRGFYWLFSSFQLHKLNLHSFKIILLLKAYNGQPGNKQIMVSYRSYVSFITFESIV